MAKKKNEEGEKPNISGSIYADRGGKVVNSQANSGINLNWHAKSLAIGWIGGILTSIVASYIWEYLIKPNIR